MTLDIGDIAADLVLSRSHLPIEATVVIMNKWGRNDEPENDDERAIFGLCNCMVETLRRCADEAYDIVREQQRCDE